LISPFFNMAGNLDLVTLTADNADRLVSLLKVIA
jgi:hypothetical protein